MIQSILSARFSKPSQLGQVNQAIADGLYQYQLMPKPAIAKTR
jgi:hypothetical protein